MGLLDSVGLNGSLEDEVLRSKKTYKEVLNYEDNQL